MLEDVREFLERHNVFEEEVFAAIKLILTDEGVQRSFLNMIDKFNPSLTDLFNFQENGETFTSIYGLLKGCLMSGDVMKNIAISFLSNFKMRNDMA